MGRGSRNNALAGGLLLAAIVASVVVIFFLAGFQDRFGKNTLTVRYDFKEGVTGLKKGSEVRLGGFKVGLVDSVAIIGADAPDPTIEVKIKVDSKTAKLRRGAVAYLETALLGSGSVINFTSMGAGPELTEADIITGRLAAPALLGAAGFGEEQKLKFRTFIDDMSQIGARVRCEVEDFSASKAKWYNDVNVMTTRGREFMDCKLPQITEGVKSGVADGQAFLAKARAMIDDNQGCVYQIIENVREASIEGHAMLANGNVASVWVTNELIPMVDSLLKDGRTKALEAIDTACALLHKADNLVGEQTPVVRTALAKLRLSADQLAATLAEVRRSPWRLIYRPDKRDLEFELLYDSARAYAQAVSDLSSSAEALKGLSDGGSLKAGDKSVQELLNSLDASFKKYEQAESEFLRQVQAKSK